MELSYSTDPKWCKKCKHLPCACKAKKPAKTKGPQSIKMRREKRRGKDLVVLFETSLHKSELQSLVKKIRKACGAGGTVKGGTIEIQGDHRDKIEEMLKSEGVKVVRAGG